MKHFCKKTTQQLVCLVLTLAMTTLTVAPASALPSGWMVLAAASKSAAAETARSRHGGKVLKVEESSDGGRKVYRVKLLLDGGRIKIVTIAGGDGNAS